MQNPRSTALRKWKKRKRRQRQLKVLAVGLFLLVMLTAAAHSLLVSEPEKENMQETGEEDIPAAVRVESPLELDETTKKALLRLAAGNARIQAIWDRREEYPGALLELLARNEEALAYVEAYLEKKDEPCAETVGAVTKGTVPLLLQWDTRWGYSMYGDGLLGVTGCGPTALSMVVSGLTGRNDVTPTVIAAYAMEQGYYVDGVGTAWDLLRLGCEKFGLRSSEVPLSETAVFRALQAGKPIICSVRPGDFTTTGHFIVLTGVSDGKIQVHDPNSKERSTRLWDYDRLASQINNMWAYTVK